MYYEVPPITNVMATLTNQCTMRCPFCFVPKEAKRMSYETLYALVQFLIRNSDACGIPPRLVFFGGEPMMEWDSLIVPITRYIREEYQKPFVLSMTTNMTLLNEERIHFLLSNDIRCLYSIDGGRETMAVNRPMADGSDPFQAVDPIIDKITGIIPNAAARITLYEPTVGNLLDDILYVERKRFGSISILPDLFSPWSPESYVSLQQQIAMYGDYLIQAFRSNREPLIFQQYSECFFKMALTNRCIEKGRFQDLSKCQACGKCGFGLGHHATADYLGNLYGCLHPGPLTPESIFYLGDIRQGVDPARSKALVEMCEDETPGGLDCAGCNLRYICDRGCAPNNYICTGRMLTPPETYCRFYRALMDDAYRVCLLLDEEKNEAFRRVFQRRVMEG